MEMMMNSQVSVLNDFLNKESQQSIIDYCRECNYHYGERDDSEDGPVTGMVSDIETNSEVYNFFKKAIEQAVPNIEMMELYRMYINCFAPGENPYFHTDGEDGITFLYYPSDLEYKWHPDNGGETQFYIDGSIYGVTPEPNRLVMFDSELLHRATAFRDGHRFTVAIKYEEPHK